MPEHDCVCDPGTRHNHRRDGEYHWIDGLLVRVGSVTEARLLKRRDQNKETS